MKASFLLLNLLLLLPASARVSMDVRPREFTTDDTATLTLRIQGGVDGTPNLNLPEGLSIVSTSRNEVIINRERETTFNFTLQADRQGDYIIGPYSMNLNGRNHAIEGIPITVKQAEVVRSSSELLAQLHIPRNRVLVQQSITVTATLYSLHQIEDVQLVDFDISGMEVSNWQGERIQDRVIDGQRFRGVRFSARVTPTRSGSFSFEPVFRVTVLEPEEDLTRSRMGMFTRNVRRRQLRIQPDPVTFEARHPPAEGRPHDFDGAIGSFSFQATASPNTLNVGEPITLRTAINGTGNIRTLLPPSMEESDDFRVFTPRLVEEDLARDLQSGRKIVEQVIIPRHAEVEEIPELRFSFFDPDRWEFTTLTAGPFPLEVTPAPEGTTTFLPGSGGLRLNVGPALLGEDLIYLKSAPGPFRSLQGMSPAAFSVWSSLPIAAWALFGWAHKRKQRLLENPSLANKRNAPRKLRRDLDALRTTDAAAIHEAIWRCLADYLGHRFQIPPGDVQSGGLAPHLQDKLKPETLQSLDAWLQRCERGRFAGPADTDTVSLAREFEAVMLALDKEAA